MIDSSGLDTKLARLLHAQGRLNVDLLRTCLAESRAQRPLAGSSLARVLVHKGVLTEDEAVQCLRTLTASEAAKLASSLADSGGRPALVDPSAEGRAWASSSSEGPATVTGPVRTDGGNKGDTLAAARSTSGSGELLHVWRPGIRIGDFQLIDQLGAGGMGVVYKAENVRTKTLYALKTLPEESDPDLVTRLKREAEALAKVGAHPNVVRIHSLGSAYGRIYLVIELVAGGDLMGRLRSGPLPVDEAARITRDLARGLAFMHAKGILHRDLKPANVLFDEEGTPKLVDFGLAFDARADRLTRTGEILGTPNFMAPEQALLDRERIGPWTDVYGLGGVFYFMLTGAAPVDGGTLIEVMTRVVQEQVKPPRSVRAGVPNVLDALCRRALAKEPEQRPSAEALAEALDAFLATRTEGEKKGAARTRRGLKAAGLLVALAAAGGLIALRAHRKPPAGSDSTPLSPVPSSSPAAVPTRAVTAPKHREPLAWRLAVGDVGSWTQTAHYSWDQKDRSGRPGFNLEYTRRFDFGWRVASVGTHAVTFAATIDRLTVDYRMTFTGEVPPNMPDAKTPVHFDSAKAEDASNPFFQAIGKRFSFTVDATTGQVSRARGVGSIQEAIFDAVSNPMLRMRYRFGDLSSETAFEESLDPLFHLFLPDGEIPGWSWEIKRSLTREQRFMGGNDLPVVLSVDEKELPEKEQVALAWRGSAAAASGSRKVEGSALFDTTRLLRSRNHEELAFGEDRIIADIELGEPGR